MSFDAWKDGQVNLATLEVNTLFHEVVESPQLKATLRAPGDSVLSVIVSPDGKTLASKSLPQGDIILWDVAEGRQRTTLKSDLGISYGMAFAPDGNSFAAGYHKRTEQGEISGGIVLFDNASGKEKTVLKHDPPRGVSRIAFSPDGKTIAALESWLDKEKKETKREVSLWDLETGKVKVTLPNEHGDSPAFSSDGKVLAMTNSIVKEQRFAGSEVKRWDCETGKDLQPLTNTVHKNYLNSLAYAPDGKTVAAADSEGNVILWDPATGNALKTIQVEGKRRTGSVVIAPDSKTLALAIGDSRPNAHEPGLIVIYDMATGRQVAKLAGHNGEVNTVAFFPDGQTLASGGSDRTIRVWDLRPKTKIDTRGAKP